jgi:murein DD-endopeptidase MepM/ murein hydrolase activator NlpD
MKLPFEGCKLREYPDGVITQLFGGNSGLYSKFNMTGHNGADLVAPHGTPLLAVEDARVVAVKQDPGGYGRHVRLRSSKRYSGAYREWTYAHCDSIMVEEGVIVKEGEKIATMGNTGFVVSGNTPFWKYNPFAGTHLHLGLRILVPSKTGWSHRGDTIKYEVKNYNNGFKGSIDPLPELVTSTDRATQLQNMKAQLLTLQSLINKLKK